MTEFWKSVFIRRSYDKKIKGVVFLLKHGVEEHTHRRFMAFFQDNPYQKDKSFWIFWSRDDGVAVASAEPYTQTTVLAPRHSSVLWAGCFSCCPTNSVKALKTHVRIWRKMVLFPSGFQRSRDNEVQWVSFSAWNQLMLHRTSLQETGWSDNHTCTLSWLLA